MMMPPPCCCRTLLQVHSGPKGFSNFRFVHSQKLNNGAVQRKRVEMFQREARRQAALVTDVQKIEVKYYGQPNDCTLIMNKNQSTPYHCAQHISQPVVDRAVVAEVDDQLWDLHRPLEDSCSLRLLHFRQKDPYYANKAFWRSASLMLGAVLETAFRDHIYVQLCSFPYPNVRSGSFVYDVDLRMESWQPTKEELRHLSGEMVKLSLARHKFERLEVDASLALHMFADNKYKTQHIPHIAAKSATGNTVVVYKMGQFVDISQGPMMSHTGHLGKVAVTAVHPLPSSPLHRVQGVALPSGFLLNHFAFGLLQRKAEGLNCGRVPSLPDEESLPPSPPSPTPQAATAPQ